MEQIIPLLLTFFPFGLLLWMANLADAQRAAGLPPSRLDAAVYTLLLAIYALLAGLGGLILVAALRAGQQGVSVTALLAAQGMAPPLLQGEIASIALIGWGLLLPALVGSLLLLPSARRVAARLLAIDPARTVHGVALSYTMLVVSYLCITLGVGLGNISDLLAAAPQAGSMRQAFVVVWTQQILLALLALVGVGWLARRSTRDALRRLGLEPISGQEILLAVGLALAGVFGMMVVGGVTVMLGMEADPDVAKLSEQLTGPLFTSVPGLLTLGFAAALGEETLLRGALQPRFGLLPTALLFALLHSNYGITLSTLIMFLMGLLLGWVRLRYNTSVAILVHASYNMILGALAFLALSLTT